MLAVTRHEKAKSIAKCPFLAIASKSIKSITLRCSASKMSTYGYRHPVALDEEPEGLPVGLEQSLEKPLLGFHQAWLQFLLTS